MNDWVEVLRAFCARNSQRRAAALIGYTPAVVSRILQGRYTGNVENVRKKVEGAIMGITVECPVLGVMRRDICEGHQVREFGSTNGLRVQLYRACRNGCPHSRVKE